MKTPDTPASKFLREKAERLRLPTTIGQRDVIAGELDDLADRLVVAAQLREKAEHERDLRLARMDLV